MPDHKDNRFVAHFDMLGMNALTKRNPDLAWERLSTLCHARNESLSFSIQRIDTEELIFDQIQTVTFSDTVIAFSKSNNGNDALAMVLLMTQLFIYSLHVCVPLRGGIAHGRFAFNPSLNLFSGPALVDAYELGESAQWLGIVIDKHTADAVSQLPVGMSPRGKRTVVEWNVQCKDGTVRRRNVVNWPETNRSNYMGTVPLTVEDFYEPFTSLFGQYKELQPAAAAKYVNTVAFFNSHFEP